MLALVCLSIGWVSTASGATSAGRVDPQFGVGGLAFSPFGITTHGGPIHLVSGPSGSPTVIYGHGMVHFRSDGSSDPGFGTHGIVPFGRDTASGGVRQRRFEETGLAADSHGRLVVFGDQADSRESYFGIEPTFESFALVLRFTPRGRLDPTFGHGKGFVRDDFGLGSDVGATDIPMVGALAGTVDSKDRPVLVAGVKTIVGGCYAKSTTRSVPRAIVRLAQSGSLDPAFGSNGLSPISGAPIPPPGLALDAAGRLLVNVGRFAGPAPGCVSGSVLIRMNKDGQLLGGFGEDGARTVERYDFGVLEPSGATILSQEHEHSIGVVRLRRDGSRDRRFGGDGVANLALLRAATGSHMRPVAVDTRGRILIAGFVRSRPEPPSGEPGGKNAFVISRLLANGEVDKRFGADGRILSSLPKPLEISAFSAHLDAQGRLLVAGRFTRPGSGAGGIVVARYLLGS